jgi:hypothetical protein
MSHDNDYSFSVDLNHLFLEPPAEIDVRATYGDVSIDEFTKRHAIGYLGLPFEWDEDDQGWSIAVRMEQLHLMARFVDDLNAMDYGEDIEIGEDDGLDELPEGAIRLFAVRAYRGD